MKPQWMEYFTISDELGGRITDLTVLAKHADGKAEAAVSRVNDHEKGLSAIGIELNELGRRLSQLNDEKIPSLSARIGETDNEMKHLNKKIEKLFGAFNVAESSQQHVKEIREAVIAFVKGVRVAKDTSKETEAR